MIFEPTSMTPSHSSFGPTLDIFMLRYKFTSHAQGHVRKKSSRKLRARLINVPSSRLPRLARVAGAMKGGVKMYGMVCGWGWGWGRGEGGAM